MRLVPADVVGTIIENICVPVFEEQEGGEYETHLARRKIRDKLLHMISFQIKNRVFEKMVHSEFGE